MGVAVDLEREPTIATRLCLDAQERLSAAVQGLDDGSIRQPSRLPGWSRGHVLTHLARNADAHARRITGALDGVDVPKYPGGKQQRVTEIEAGARRSAAEILADLTGSQALLAGLLRQADAAGWPHADFTGGSHYGVGACPAHRLREVEMHHVDLDVGYEPTRWSDEYVEWETHYLADSVVERMHDPRQSRSFLAWLAGRGPADPAWTLDPWG